jgi:hypothetical protein
MSSYKYNLCTCGKFKRIESFTAGLAMQVGMGRSAHYVYKADKR